MESETLSKLLRSSRLTLFAVVGVTLGACGDSPSDTEAIVCDLDTGLLLSSLAPNAIPALNRPEMVLPDDEGADYLFDTDRILGVVVDGEARAYPHNVLWHHEIVNDRIGETDVSVTFCPLTGSGLAFSPEFDGRFLDLGVSGFLFANNLVMYDRLTGEVYGPQLGIEGACEGFRGGTLALQPVQEMSWGRWKELHPETRVVSSDLGFSRNYRFYPYGNYDDPDNTELIAPMIVDRSRPLKERVLAIREGSGGKGYPFGELRALGAQAVINEVVANVPTVVFFESRDGEAALAFDARIDGGVLTFSTDPSGQWVDGETGSSWAFNGVATSGPLEGRRLRTREDAYTLFWFAWKHFQPKGLHFTAS